MIKRFLKNVTTSIAMPLLNQIHKYKDRHKGESCYIMGDGHSIKWFNLPVFNDKISLTCAMLPIHRDFDALNAQYLNLSEPLFFYPFHRTTSQPRKIIKNQLQKMYVQDVVAKYKKKIFFINISNYPCLRGDNIVYSHEFYLDNALSKNFISHRINCYTGSLRWATLLAIYMGFDSIHLVGCDYVNSPARARHWYERGDGIFLPQQNYENKFFEIAKEFIDITSITLDGNSHLAKSITYKEYTGLDPMYKENTELVKSKHLDILSSWPGYTIF